MVIAWPATAPRVSDRVGTTSRRGWHKRSGRRGVSGNRATAAWLRPGSGEGSGPCHMEAVGGGSDERQMTASPKSKGAVRGWHSGQLGWWLTSSGREAAPRRHACAQGSLQPMARGPGFSVRSRRRSRFAHQSNGTARDHAGGEHGKLYGRRFVTATSPGRIIPAKPENPHRSTTAGLEGGATMEAFSQRRESQRG